MELKHLKTGSTILSDQHKLRVVAAEYKTQCEHIQQK